MKEKIYFSFYGSLKICLLVFIAVFYSCNTTKQNKSTKKPVKKVTENKSKNTENKYYTDNFYKEYSKKLGIDLIGNEDKQFIAEVAGWLNVPYKYGGKTKEGTDCSGLSTAIYKNLYNIDLYRSSEDQLKNVTLIEKSEVKAGDLLFFKISGGKISHVGIYISKNKFIHASTKRGVVINDLNEDYYIKTFYKCGRVIKKNNKMQ
jgi:cell wall-associated NlpC family hydrolase